MTVIGQDDACRLAAAGPTALDPAGDVDRMPPGMDHQAALAALTRLLGAEFQRRWPSGRDKLGSICRYALLPAGKLLRPLLCLESVAAVGGDLDQVLPAAAGIEYAHVGSLAHDDIIDHDELRRGRDSVPHRYGAEDAIVAGDGLIFSTFLSLAACRETGVPAERIVEALHVTAAAALDVCRGQLLEPTLCGDLSSGIDAYLSMITLKTAALLRGSCQVGAILGGGSPEQVRALGSYGEKLGVAFQIHDDLLPYTSDTTTAGKAAISDVRNRRPTLPILLAHRAARSRDRHRIELILAGRLEPEAAHRELGGILARTGALTATRHAAAQQARQAVTALDLLPPSANRERLVYLAAQAIHRDR